MALRDSSSPDHSSFSKNRHGRFRDSDLLRKLFETVVLRCMAEGLVGGDGFYASLIPLKLERCAMLPIVGQRSL